MIKQYKIVLFVLALFILLIPKNSFSQALRQFQHSFAIGNKYPAALIIVGEEWHENAINNVLRSIEIKTNELYNQLSLQNPNGALSKFNRTKEGKYEIMPELADALRMAINISGWTKGAFDITNGYYKKMEVDKKNPYIKLGMSDIKSNLDPIMEGILADYMIKLAKESNANNAIAKVNMTFRSIGVSNSGPWKIQIQDSEGTFAHHAMNLTLGDVGVATVSVNQFMKTSHMTASQKQAQCKGVAIIAKDATSAQGIAYAIFNMGPSAGLELLNKIPNLRGLIVDLNGRFYRSNNF